MKATYIKKEIIEKQDATGWWIDDESDGTSWIYYVDEDLEIAMEIEINRAKSSTMKMVELSDLNFDDMEKFIHGKLTIEW